jgi:hypothetical protein
MTIVLPTVLDQILAYQLIVAWAGEALCEPPRLGWWRTDVVDKDGGGDLFKRLLPNTGQWAGLETARQAAICTDFRGRQELAGPDNLTTLFFWGFEIDEQLSDRLTAHKQGEMTPQQALPIALDFGKEFSRSTFETMLTAPIKFEVVRGGREIKGPPPVKLEDQAQALVAALLNPLPECYPLPFYQRKV